MVKVAIIGGGIAGLTAGIYLQKAGFETEIYEKNQNAGGLCTGWYKKEVLIDNCIHWITGTKPKSDLNQLWLEIGLIKQADDFETADYLFLSKFKNGQITFWKDWQRTQKEMLTLFPEDSESILQFFSNVLLLTKLQIPAKKPFQFYHLFDFLCLIPTLAIQKKIQSLYGDQTIADFANHFKNPYLRQAFLDHFPSVYPAYMLLSTYASFISGNAAIAPCSSLELSNRVVDKYLSLGGKIHYRKKLKHLTIVDENIASISFEDNYQMTADKYILAYDINQIYQKLLSPAYFSKKINDKLSKLTNTTHTSSFQVAYQLDSKVDFLANATFPIRELSIATKSISRISVKIKKAKNSEQTIVYVSIFQDQEDYQFWHSLSKGDYKRLKLAYANQIKQLIFADYTHLINELSILDIWTPLTYYRYCNVVDGSFMGAIPKERTNSLVLPSKLSKIKNLWFANQWLMSPGGLPIAGIAGKFAAYEISKEKLR